MVLSVGGSSIKILLSVVLFCQKQSVFPVILMKDAYLQELFEAAILYFFQCWISWSVSEHMKLCCYYKN
jgi:hypothetical protein